MCDVKRRLACFWLWKLFAYSPSTTSLHWVGDVWVWVSTCCRDFLCYILRVYYSVWFRQWAADILCTVILVEDYGCTKLASVKLSASTLSGCVQGCLGQLFPPFCVESAYSIYCTCRISLYTCSRTENFRFAFWESLNTGLEKMLSNWRPCPPSPFPWPQQKQFFQKNWKIEYSSVGIFPLFLEQELTVRSFGFSRRK